MTSNKILFVTILVTVTLSGIWYWAEKHDYFQTAYKYASLSEQQKFHMQDADDSEKLIERYRQSFKDNSYSFPRQTVTKIKLYNNTPFISGLSGLTLKQEYNDTLIKFCNDTANFTWDETTWEESESDYYLRLYNKQNKIVGKLFICLDGCYMIKSIPVTPRMKFGGLSEKGMNELRNLLNNKSNWE